MERIYAGRGSVESRFPVLRHAFGLSESARRLRVDLLLGFLLEVLEQVECLAFTVERNNVTPAAVALGLAQEPWRGLSCHCKAIVATIKIPRHLVRTALLRVLAGMSTPADDVDKTENDVRRTEEVVQQGADQDQELPTETKPAGPLPDFNT
jgi:hypothetical protein